MEDETIQPSETFVAIGTTALNTDNLSYSGPVGQNLSIQSNVSQIFTNPPQPQNIMICVKDHTVTLNLETGSVDLGGADLDEAALAFWDAVQRIAGRR